MLLQITHVRNHTGERAHLNDVQGLVDGGLGVKGQAGVNLGGDTAGNNLQDLAAELDQDGVEGGIDLLVEGALGLLANGDSLVNELGVLGLLGGSQDQRGVGGGILGLVLGNGCERVCELSGVCKGTCNCNCNVNCASWVWERRTSEVT